MGKVSGWMMMGRSWREVDRRMEMMNGEGCGEVRGGDGVVIQQSGSGGDGGGLLRRRRQQRRDDCMM